MDGTQGSAVAGLRRCLIQSYDKTPKPVWNPDIPQPIKFFETWSEVPGLGTYDNGFKAQWEMFLRHVAIGTPYIYDFYEGATGVQLAEHALRAGRGDRALPVLGRAVEHLTKNELRRADRITQVAIGSSDEALR